MADSSSFHIGIDENGLGPRLGPMIVTAIMARVRSGAESLVTRAPSGPLADRLGDSKGLVAHGKITLAEAWTQALVHRGAGRHRRADRPDHLVDAVTLDERDTLTQPCPTHVKDQCWGCADEHFTPSEQLEPIVSTVNRDLDQLAEDGVEIMAVRSVVLCAKRLNAAADQGRNRFVEDLHAMERLILALRDIAGSEVEAICGKVGGFSQYPKAFGPLSGRLHTVLEEGRGRSAYRFPELGEIAFVRDCDAENMLVGMASLVGKYLRELLMGRIVQHYRAIDDSLPTASGYHDPVTKNFILGTEAVRQAREIPLGCFERHAAKRRPR